MREDLSFHMRVCEAEAILFAPRVERSALQSLNLDSQDARVITINVRRNHAFEPIESLLKPFVGFGGWKSEFHYSDYDDSFHFQNLPAADIELVWLDSTRYLRAVGVENFIGWLSERINALRQQTHAPILMATWLDTPGLIMQLQAALNRVPAVYFCDLKAVCSEVGVNLLDTRVALMAGSPIRSEAQVILARKLGCHWLPAAILPPVKGIVLDLDNTLYSGVLGEDGALGVNLTTGHRELQTFLKQLVGKGVFLAIVSRNEREDVEALFAERTDFPLCWADFSATEISWGDKADALIRVADTLRIAPDALVFVDDNPGELAQVVQSLQHIGLLYALPDATLTQRALEYYPGLWRWRLQTEDMLRVEDLKASAQRAILQAQTDPDDYLRSLGVTLQVRIDPVDQLNRAASLCSKTNQFNLAMRRFSEPELTGFLQDKAFTVTCVHLRDRLSDSGTIAVLVAERVVDTCIVQELCISCRALGRRLEDTIIFEAIRQMPTFQGCNYLQFAFRRGPRNEPARRWLSEVMGTKELPDSGSLQMAADVVRTLLPNKSICIERD